MPALSPSQCRAARALLDWSQSDLAAHASVSRSVVNDYENETRIPHENRITSMYRALEAAGVVFISKDKKGGPGVRLVE